MSTEDTAGHYSQLKEEDEAGTAFDPPNYQQGVQPSVINAAQPALYSTSPPPQISGQRAIEMQPVVNAQPQFSPPIEVVQPPKANDHLFFTGALLFACLLCASVTGGVTFLGALCLLPALLCAAVGADFNKEGKTEIAKTLGIAAMICNIIVIGINIALVVLAAIGGIVALALLVNTTNYYN